jgi:hypothetical protein
MRAFTFSPSSSRIDGAQVPSCLFSLIFFICLFQHASAQDIATSHQVQPDIRDVVHTMWYVYSKICMY